MSGRIRILIEQELGRIAIRTNNHNLMISINGQLVSPPAENSDGIMRLIVPTGNNTIEVLLPDSSDRWSKEINVPARGMMCLALTHSVAIINKDDSKTDPPRAQGAKIKMVEYITDSYQECENESSLNDAGIKLSAHPGGYPILIDGQPAGNATQDARQFILEPGTHAIEVRFPDNQRWVREFTVTGGKKLCVSLVYQRASAPKVDSKSAPISPVEQVLIGDVTVDERDCGEITSPGGEKSPLPNVTKEWKKINKP